MASDKIHMNPYAAPVQRRPAVNQYRIQVKDVSDSSGDESNDETELPPMPMAPPPMNRFSMPPPPVMIPTFTIDQMTWDSLQKRLINDECEIEKLKNVQKRLDKAPQEAYQLNALQEEIKSFSSKLRETEEKIRQQTEGCLVKEFIRTKHEIDSLSKQVNRNECFHSLFGSVLGVLLLFLVFSGVHWMVANPNFNTLNLN